MDIKKQPEGERDRRKIRQEKTEKIYNTTRLNFFWRPENCEQLLSSSSATTSGTWNMMPSIKKWTPIFFTPMTLGILNVWEKHWQDIPLIFSYLPTLFVLASFQLEFSCLYLFYYCLSLAPSIEYLTNRLFNNIQNILTILHPCAVLCALHSNLTKTNLFAHISVQ